MDGNAQSNRLGSSVLVVREDAGGTLAVLYVRAFCLFEQPETREHDGQSSNALTDDQGEGWWENQIAIEIGCFTDGGNLEPLGGVWRSSTRLVIRRVRYNLIPRFDSMNP